MKHKIANVLNIFIDEMDVNEIYNNLKIPPNSKMGDISFPCFELAKKRNESPEKIAQKLSNKINEYLRSE